MSHGGDKFLLHSLPTGWSQSQRRPADLEKESLQSCEPGGTPANGSDGTTVEPLLLLHLSCL